MTTMGLALRYLFSRPALNLLTVLGVAVGVALVVAAATLSAGAQKSTKDIAGGYQLLVAAKGSPAQAVLSTLFFIEAPTGNIPIEVYDDLRGDDGAKLLVPFNFGDSYKGRFIVGTTDDYRHVIELITGRAPVTNPVDKWAEKPFDAVIGSSVARDTGLKPGDTFLAAHGFIELPSDLVESHDEHKYTVVAVLKPTQTPADRAIFTTLESSWITHGEMHDDQKSEDSHSPEETNHEGEEDHAEGEGHHEEGDGHHHHGENRGEHVTALLIHGRGYADVARLATALNQRGDVQAIFPGRVAGQIMVYMQAGQSVLLALAWLSIGIATIAVMISLLAASIERQRQIATLRAIGASRRSVFGVLLGEAAFVCLAGGLVGILLGRLAAAVIAWRIEETNGLQLSLPPLGSTELITVAGAVMLGLIAGAIPAYGACRADVTKNLMPVT